MVIYVNNNKKETGSTEKSDLNLVFAFRKGDLIGSGIPGLSKINDRWRDFILT
jgi:hypothetical protein